MLIQPHFLNTGDKVAIVAPARKVAPQEILPGINFLKSCGFEVLEGEHLYKVQNQFAGTDNERTSDFQSALDDPAIKAIICARGGYGTSRIIDSLDFTNFNKSPKWITGFSDNTAIHCHLHKLGFQSIHSTVPLLMGESPTLESDNSLAQALTGNLLSQKVKKSNLNKYGTASATIVGGNLSLIVNMIGTSSDLNTRGKILFIEDLDENLYHFDRMLVQLKRANKLDGIKGLLVGHFSKIKDDKEYYGKSIHEIISDSCKNLNIPICYNWPAGHESQNIALYLGRKVYLDINEKGTSVTYI